MRFLFKPLIPLTILVLVTASLLLLEERKTFDYSTLVQINPIPHTQELIKQKKYVEAEEYLQYFMAYNYVKKNPEANSLLKEIHQKRNDFTYKANKFLEGILKGGSDEDIGKASAIASDFLVIGDVRDLSIEGKHYVNDEKVDKIMVTLSSLGLLATASTVYSLGATTPIKSTISTLKYGRRLNKLPNWFNKQLMKQAKLAKETNSFKTIQSLFKPINQLYNKVGLTQMLNLLKKSKNLKELKSLARFTKRFGKKSNIFLNLTRNKALKYAHALPNVQPKTLFYASTYGERGLKGVSKMGEKKFIKRMKFRSNLAKIAYKGNLNPLFNWLLKHLPNSLLYAITFVGLFYFSSKFFALTKRLL